ncbi:MAG TPA: menaquinone biosynthesis protein [Bacteroidales bacterium]|nr:menaquinone biosynthesis protein [Bacteroidales bacterium]HPS62475.1 menaquinone biosynthesis protein [Bacteroidales bacterium]
MDSLRISAVSYLNTFPFVYGLRESGILDDFHLRLEVPSKCAESLKSGEADIALIPAGALPGIGEYHFAADFCIGAVGSVKTVLLLSSVPMDQIRKIFLDLDSRTSVELVRVLAGHHWKINPGWEHLRQEIGISGNMEAVVAIGDKTFRLRQQYPFVWDLADHWITFTGLPMVFAVWVSRKPLPAEVRDRLNKALAWGIAHRKESVEYFLDRLPCPAPECLSYLEHNISYELDEKKREGLKLFLEYLGTRKNP